MNFWKNWRNIRKKNPDIILKEIPGGIIEEFLVKYLNKVLGDVPGVIRRKIPGAMSGRISVGISVGILGRISEEIFGVTP